MRAAAMKAARLEGLDLARYLALVGMVFVNFRLAMHPSAAAPSWLAWFHGFLEGKASATFVVLAGLGLALATRDLPLPAAAAWTARRALFLLGVGLANLAIFPADIIHYYAAYFLLAVPLLHAGTRWLALAVAAIASASTWVLLRFDYGAGWNWATLDYADFWTLAGFTRNLVFNGFHPLLPWMALFTYGMLLGRLRLDTPRVQRTLCWLGLALALCAQACAVLARGTPWAALAGTTPMPPGPVYLLAGIASATLAIGACLQLARRREGAPLPAWMAAMIAAGRMTLSLYLAHIVLGMGLLEALGALDGSRALAEATLAAAVYLACGTLAAWHWSRRRPHGPAEALMRRFAPLPRTKPACAQPQPIQAAAQDEAGG